jgi:K(+)-stimulated pyrophosphate-energized sodium pump
MIKVMNLVSLLAAPVLVQYKASDWGMITTLVICSVIVIVSVLYSKNGGFKFLKGNTVNTSGKTINK